MASVRGSQNIASFTAGADLSATARQFCVVSLNTTAEQVIRPSAANKPCIGVLQNKPASGAGADVCIHGTTKVKANGTFSIGDRLMAAATTGKVDTATAAATPYNATHIYVLGWALEAAATAGNVVEMFFHPFDIQS